MRALRSAFACLAVLASTATFAQELSAPPPPPPLEPNTPPIPPPTPAASVAPAAAVAPAASATPAATVEAKKEEPPVKQPSVRLFVGPGVLSRSLTWSTVGRSPYPDYVNPSGMTMNVGAQWFPGAHFKQGGPANVGLFAEGTFGLGFQTQGYGTTWGTHTQRLRAGALLRVPVGHGGFDLHLAYVQHDFGIDPKSVDGVNRPKLPDISLSGVRLGADGRFALGPVNLDLGLGGLVAVGLGELATTAYFPSANGFGFDFRAGLGVPFADVFEARLGFDYARNVVALNADASSAVTGLADQYLAGSLSLACRL